MHINVSHILTGEVGDSASFEITGENPDIPDLELVQPITGRLTATKLDNRLRLAGRVRLAFHLECQRCLDSYNHQAELVVNGLFSASPGEDEWPISARGEIDLAPLIREEALLRIPVQQLCDSDCRGLCEICGQKLADGHQHEHQDLGHKPRVKPAGITKDAKKMKGKK